MKFCPVLILLLVAVGTKAQELDLSEGLTPDENPSPKPTEEPKARGKIDTDELDLSVGLDFGSDKDQDIDTKPGKPAVKPPKGGTEDLFSLGDALDPGKDPKPEKPVKPKTGGGGTSFQDSDLDDVSDGSYKPDGGRSGGGQADPGNDPHGGADQPQEASSGPLAGIISAIGVALLGAASSYFAYQKKKLCFKVQGGEDPESGKGQRVQSDPQVLSNLLRTS